MATDIIAQIESLMRTDPILRQLGLRFQNQADPRGAGNERNPIFRQIQSRQQELLRHNGLTVPKDYSIMPNGKVTKNSFAQRNADWIVPAVAGVTAAGFIPGLIPGTGNAPVDYGSVTNLPAFPSGAGAGSAAGAAGAAGATPSVVDAVTNSGGGRKWTDLFKDPTFWSSLIGSGALLGGAAMQSNAAGDAAKLQADAIQKAIDLQREMWQTQRSDLAPYRGIGQGSAAKAGYLLGIPGFEAGPTEYLAQSRAQNPVPTNLAGLTPGTNQQPPSGSGMPPVSYNTQPFTRESDNNAGPVTFPPGTYPQRGATNLAGLGPQPMVRLMAPDGSQRSVPQGEAEFFISRGAKRLA